LEKKQKSMNEELEKQFYWLRNFTCDELVGLKLEKILVCEDLKTKNVIYIYLKILDDFWQKFSLSAGAGFWENTEICEYAKLEEDENDEYFEIKDYTTELDVKDKVISKIHYEPNDDNCKIIIELENKERIILRCKNSKTFDDECEIFKE
jgi:hypothetical protein